MVTNSISIWAASIELEPEAYTAYKKWMLAVVGLFFTYAIFEWITVLKHLVWDLEMLTSTGMRAT